MKKLPKSEVELELRLAGELYANGDLTNAIRKADAVLRKNPDCVAAHFSKGTFLMAVDRQSEALASFTQALRYEPNNADVLAWAVHVSLSLRIPTQTESFARRLTRLQPENDRAYFFLSIALTLLGQWLDALKAIDGSLALQPANPDYVVGKAQLLSKLHQNSSAIYWYRKALEMGPAPQIATELAEILMEENQVQEAIALLEKYTDDIPVEFRPNALIGRAYTEGQRFEEAAKHWSSAIDFSTDRTGLLAVRAKSEMSSGRLRVAEELLRAGLENDPKSTELFSLLAQITKLTSADAPLIQQMEQLLGNGALNTEEEHALDFALGKSFHDLGDFEKAISFYDDANRLRGELTPRKLRFDREDWKSNIDMRMRFFTKERIAALSNEGIESSKPLFVVGMIRSGTTLCEQILSCHTKIQDGGEVTFWGDHHGELVDQRTGRFDSATARRLGKEYLKILGSSGSDAQYVIDKNPLNVLVGTALLSVFRNAKMIHTMRHPVDNLLSIWMTPTKTGLQYISNREDLVFAYREYKRLASYMQEVLPADRFATFSYEDITSNPVPTIERILGFLNLNVESACFSPEKNPRTVRTPSVYQVRQPINTDSQARWKQYEPWLGPFGELLQSEVV